MTTNRKGLNRLLGTVAAVGGASLLVAAGVAVAGSAAAIPAGGPTGVVADSAPGQCGAYVVGVAPAGVYFGEPCWFFEPPGPPSNVVGVPGNGQVVVSWTASTYPGSDAIQTYEVTASPGGSTCVATVPYTTPPSPPPTTCTVTGLANGTAYTFTVRANNNVDQSYSGGWSVPSDPSPPVTPTGATPSPAPSPSPTTPTTPSAAIKIEGSRSGNTVSVTAQTYGLGAGAEVTVYAKTSSRGTYRAWTSVAVPASGSVKWTRSLSKARTLWIFFRSGESTSNVLRLTPR